MTNYSLKKFWFSKTLKANKILHQYFEGPIKILGTDLFSDGDGQQLEAQEFLYFLHAKAGTTFSAS